MKREEFAVGARVRLIKRIGGIYPGSMYNIAPGPTGTVDAVFPDADEDSGEPIAHIRLDEPHPHLEDWDNVLQISIDGDATPDDFELLPLGFY